MNLSAIYPRDDKPLSAIRSLGAMRPVVRLLGKGVPLGPLSKSDSQREVPESAVNTIMQGSFDSLRALKKTGEVRHYAQLQGLVAAMLEIQRVGDVRLTDARPIRRALETLDRIQARHMDLHTRQWGRIVLTAPEEAAIESAIHNHGAQMLNLSRGALMDAIRRSMRMTGAEAAAIAERVCADAARSENT